MQYIVHLKYTDIQISNELGTEYSNIIFHFLLML